MTLVFFVALAAAGFEAAGFEAAVFGGPSTLPAFAAAGLLFFDFFVSGDGAPGEKAADDEIAV
jgi:hypothetical protein